MKTKYRILEIEGQFYPQARKCWLWDFIMTSGWEDSDVDRIAFSTLEEAKNFILEIEKKKTPPPVKIHHANL